MASPPRAAYRIQFNAGFTFEDGAALADYLEALGVSHLYASPCLQAAPGSTHGYDLVDPGRPNPELGGADGFARLSAALGERGLGLVLDVVVNHMDITAPQNAWWWDVLENGQASRYAGYFDVDWDPPEVRLGNKILLPILADHYGRVLEAGELRIERRDGSFTVHYRDRMLPVAPGSLDGLLARAAAGPGSEELAFIADSFGRLPPTTATDRERLRRRHRDKEVLRSALRRLLGERPAVAAAVDAAVAEINADPDRLHELLERQNYRLAFWRAAQRDLGYRRFFDNTALIGIRAEGEAVFNDTHRLVLEWVRSGAVTGLRIDHPDGLRDPEQYFRRLREAAPGAWIVAEKILQPGERLPESWPVEGTTGYDFLNLVTRLFTDPAGEEPLGLFYTEFTGRAEQYRAVANESKHQVAEELFGSEIARLAELAMQVCERHRRFRDYTRTEVREALTEILTCFPVYRTYVRAESGQVAESDRLLLESAVSEARERQPDLDGALFDLLLDILLLRLRGELESELVMRLEQLTGPLMAKGLEDTAFYRYNRLLALNEVGGDPAAFALAPGVFHAAMAARAAGQPHSMLASSTHDTKRCEDVRARLALLSEIPGQWAGAVRRWSAHNAPHRRGEAPDRNTEYLLYQTLVGAWPLEKERAAAFMEKAMREAKAQTSWLRPNPEYEGAVRAFLDALYADEPFQADLAAFAGPLVEPGRTNSLAQELIKLTAPGVPDIYQGTEIWDLSLVDPDNRRPVDYALRRRLLAELDGLAPEEIRSRADEGLPKLWVVRQALRLRARQPEALDGTAAYRALPCAGAKAAHAVAFLRGETVATIAPRLVLGLGGDWADTTLVLPPGRWRNELTGEDLEGGALPLAELLKRFPLALLARSDEHAT